ncbi:hypothetical protein FQN57_002336 [Myotisia sp. PD_48]|nr:hypothetical protein FQN57_002336 [Myotisia sp. PD_48]
MAHTSPPGVLTSLFRWLRLKNYQYEVTFALYMLTPIEKVIFNTLILLLLSMFLTAAYIYLPNHIITIYHHIYYYWAGHPLSEPLHAQAAHVTLSAAAAASEAIGKAFNLISLMENIANATTATGSL